MTAMILWFLLHLSSAIVPSHPTLYRLNMWSSWLRRKGTTQFMYIAKLKDGPKRVKKILNDFGKGFWNGMMDREKMGSHRKWFLKLKCLSPLKMLTSPLFEETFGASLFFCSISWGLGVLMIFEVKITSSKTSFQMTLIYWRWTHVPEWSYAWQHG
jgi:hypothetical protein